MNRIENPLRKKLPSFLIPPENSLSIDRQVHKLSWTTLAVCMFQLAEWKYFLALRRMFRVWFAVVVSMFWFATRRDPFVLQSAGVARGVAGVARDRAAAGDNREQEGAHWLCPRSCHLVRRPLLPITHSRRRVPDFTQKENITSKYFDLNLSYIFHGFRFFIY